MDTPIEGNSLGLFSAAACMHYKKKPHSPDQVSEEDNKQERSTFTVEPLYPRVATELDGVRADKMSEQSEKATSPSVSN